MFVPVGRAEPAPGDEVDARRDGRRRVDLERRQVLDQRDQTVRRWGRVELLGDDRDPAGGLAGECDGGHVDTVIVGPAPVVWPGAGDPGQNGPSCQGPQIAIE